MTDAELDNARQELARLVVESEGHPIDGFLAGMIAELKGRIQREETRRANEAKQGRLFDGD